MPLINSAGRHAVTAKQVQLGQSDTGTPFVQIAFEDDAGAAITGWLYLSEAAFERTVAVLREVFGFDDNFDTIVGQVEGKRCSIVCENETYQGKERLKVKWINPEGGGGGAPAKPLSNQSELLKQLTAKAARIAKPAAKAPNAARPAQTPRPATAQKPAPAASEDEPF
ncbi:MAG TPA: hypothetical protein VL357_01760 [Rariglobus sp.]|jgi:hypothetical protein|nr:hypothetical protein [Rariglobus sp.]